ncbi:CbrC family protein [Lysinibacillus sp. FSL H8-0500]|uniref:CbrC family protein n=1 Tax=Lysinibacillus sp. FSL H8-0500 TaxID=2921393 RepID=UPI003101038E
MTTNLIEQWHQQRKTFNSADAKSIHTMHKLKEQVKQAEPTEANLRILVDIYCMLRMYNEAYKVFTAVMDLTNKKDQKKYGSIKYWVDNPQHVSPLLPRDIQETNELTTPLPTFKYMPNPLQTGVFEIGEIVVCDCCEQEVDIYCTKGIYAIEEVEYLCPSCIHSGRAAQKFDGEFQQDLLNPELVSNEDYTKEVLYRTPDYISWQGNNWLAHCTDYCAFLGYVGWQELMDMGITKVLEHFNGYTHEELAATLRNNGSHQGYLFQCLECQQYIVYSDWD